MINDTIVALATPNMKSAVSIIRLSGQDCLELVDRFCSINLQKCLANTINYGFIVDEKNKKLDEVLISVFKAPHSFTGENVIEVNTHGGINISRKILNLFLSNGARMAQPGEFSQRAYLNNRIDLIEVEAIADMIDARSDHASELAMLGLTKKTTFLIDDLKEKLIQIIAQIEAKIDYPEYDDIADIAGDELGVKLTEFKDDITRIIDASKTGKLIKNGIKIALIGQPNVGKSSLLNAFLNENKAIVTEVAGTTRDIIEADYSLNGIDVTFLDTAGIRSSDDVVEKIGIARSYEALAKADLILLVLDNSKQELTTFEADLINNNNDNLLIVLNKSDLGNNLNIEGLKISALKGDIATLTQAISERLDLNINIENEALFLSNERHLALLNKVKLNIDEATKSLTLGMSNDLIIEDLELAYHHLQELLGNNKADLLDELFSRFCLGK